MKSNNLTNVHLHYVKGKFPLIVPHRHVVFSRLICTKGKRHLWVKRMTILITLPMLSKKTFVTRISPRSKSANRSD